jgi:thiosulfate/3-mercaptopyruvate sulfurtransferase
MTDHLVVSTQWLADHLNDPNVRIIDIRGHVIPPTEPPPHYFNHRADYDVSHIPGAVFIDWVKEITDPGDPRHAQIAKPERFAEAMSRAGIGADTFVVTYDDSGMMIAARLWWALNYYGHSKVAVLDGGWNKWVAEGRPVDAVIPNIAPASFVAVPNPAWHRSADQVAAGSWSNLIDMRSKDEFDGKASRAKRAGHIPGAVSQPRSELLAADGTLLPSETLKEKFAALGVREDADDVVFYCNGGVSASFGLLASKAAGVQNGAMYDGSWKEWGNDESRPIE